MIFMTQKNYIRLAKLIAQYSVAFDAADKDQQHGLMDFMSPFEQIVLYEFFVSRDAFRQALMKNNGNNGGDGAAIGSAGVKIPRIADYVPLHNEGDLSAPIESKKFNLFEKIINSSPTLLEAD